MFGNTGQHSGAVLRQLGQIARHQGLPVLPVGWGQSPANQRQTGAPGARPRVLIG